MATLRRREGESTLPMPGETMKRIPLPWGSIHAVTTGATWIFLPVTGYMSTAQFKRVRAVIETIDLMTTFSLKFGYPLCNVETSPQAAVAVGGAITTDTVSFGTLTDISADIDDYQFIRFGYLTQNTAAASLILGRAGGYVEYTDA